MANTTEGVTILSVNGTTSEINFTSSPLDNVTSAPASYSSGYIRNFILGSFGIFANAGAILALSQSKRIKCPLKIYLSGLVASDMIFMLSCTMSLWSGIPEDINCSLVAFGSNATLNISYIMTALISIHNYLAVFYASKFQSLVTTKRVLAAVIVTWLFGWSLTLSGLGLPRTQEGQCAPFLKLPKFVVILTVAVSTVSLVVVLVLNFRVVFFLKANNRVGPRKSGMQQTGETLGETGVTATTNVPERVVSPLQKHQVIRNRIQRETVVDDCNSTTSLDDVNVAQADRDYAGTVTLHHSNGLPVDQRLLSNATHFTNTKPIIMTPGTLQLEPAASAHIKDPKEFQHNLYNSLELSQTDQNIRNSLAPSHVDPRYLSVSVTTSSGRDSPCSLDPLRRRHSLSLEPRQPVCDQDARYFNDRQSKRGTAALQADNNSVCSSARQRRRATGRQAMMKKISSTLSILTLWCCGLNFPFTIYMLVSVSLETGLEREKLHRSAFGMITGSLLLLNAVSNPILCAWRFVDWRKVCVKLCKCRGR